MIPTDNQATGSDTADVATHLTREDLAALHAAYLRESRGWKAWAPTAGVIGGMAVGVVLLTLREALHWSASLDPVLFALGWVIAIGSAGLGHRYLRRLRQRHQLHCPSCETPLIDAIQWRGAVSRIELAIATGRCPSCGAPIVAE